MDIEQLRQKVDKLETIIKKYEYERFIQTQQEDHDINDEPILKRISLINNQVKFLIDNDMFDIYIQENIDNIKKYEKYKATCLNLDINIPHKLAIMDLFVRGSMKKKAKFLRSFFNKTINSSDLFETNGEIFSGITLKNYDVGDHFILMLENGCVINDFILTEEMKNTLILPVYDQLPFISLITTLRFKLMCINRELNKPFKIYATILDIFERHQLGVLKTITQEFIYNNKRHTIVYSDPKNIHITNFLMY